MEYNALKGLHNSVTLVVEHNGKSLVYNRTHHHRAKLSRQLCA